MADPRSLRSRRLHRRRPCPQLPGAAGLRGVSASALSEAIRRLEARLGVRLLNRTTRSVTPTEAGAAAARAAGARARARSPARSMRSTISATAPTGTLRLNVPTGVATTVLPPIVARFLAAHPGITLEVTADDTFIDVLAAGFDAGIRYDERLEHDMIAVPIGPRAQHFALAAAPAYLAGHGTPKHPRDLLNHACIRHRFASGVLAAWEFERGGKVRPRTIRAGRWSRPPCAGDCRRRRRPRPHPHVRGIPAAGIRRRRARAGAPRLVPETSPDRFSITRAAPTCRRRCAPSSISSSGMAREKKLTPPDYDATISVKRSTSAAVVCQLVNSRTIVSPAPGRSATGKLSAGHG